jgi:hypothetical protein
MKHQFVAQPLNFGGGNREMNLFQHGAGALDELYEGGTSGGRWTV